MSWVATTFFLACLFAGPLATGRLICFIIRVPDMWIHDPFTFAVGSVIFFPALLSFLNNTVCSRQSLVGNMFHWASQFRYPPHRKLRTFLATSFLMGSLSPLLIGSVLDVAFMKSNDWFQGKEDWIDINSIMLNWLLGVVVLCVLLQLCSSQELRFMNDPFYGRNGRAAKFIDVIRAVVFRFEWDKVDARLLLDEVAMPVTSRLALELGGPMLVLMLSFWEFPLYPVARRRLMTRACLFFTAMLLSQTKKVWKTRVHRWFEAAHRVARDDRFLIGEVLLNYSDR
jgi:E3 ubiquitin-protein ligase MARCH6